MFPGNRTGTRDLGVPDRFPAAKAMLRADSPGCQGRFDSAEQRRRRLDHVNGPYFDKERPRVTRPRAVSCRALACELGSGLSDAHGLFAELCAAGSLRSRRAEVVKPRESGVAEKPRLLVIDRDSSHEKSSVDCLSESFERVTVRTISKALVLLRDQKFDGVFVDASQLSAVRWVGMMMQAGEILDAISDGVAVVDPDLRIIWANPEFQLLAGSSAPTVGGSFYRGAREGRGPGPGAVSVHLGRGVEGTREHRDEARRRALHPA